MGNSNDIVINDAYECFAQEYIDEIDSIAIHLQHKQSGADIIILSNDNPHKVFNISFLTPPHNDTGIPHILEHCVLSGSRKYNTGYYEMASDYLADGTANAVTSAMTTEYYFSSKKAENFRQCMDIFLDAVFYPLVLENKNIFKREGWRYEIVKDENGERYIDINGIVLNEMKAKDSSFIHQCWDAVYKKLTPDCSDYYHSGGLSYKIPYCEYEDLVEYHRTYYTPANSYIYLYGDIDINDTLEFLDREYLSVLCKGKKIEVNKTSKPKKRKCSKKIIKTDREEKHIYLYSSLFEGKMRPYQALAFNIFSEEIEFIVESNLKGIGINAYVTFVLSQMGEKQDKLEFIIETDEIDAGKDICKVISKSFSQNFREDEIFRAKIMSRINNYELGFWEEMNEKCGCGFRLLRMLQQYWYYETDDLFEVFEVADNLQYIKNRMWGECYNSLISNAIPKDRREVIVECFPKNCGEDYFEYRLRNTIDEKISDFSEEDIARLIVEEKEYEQWREGCKSDSTEEEKQKWKMISTKVDDYINIEPVNYEKYVSDGICYLHIPEKQNKVVWMCLSFNADKYKEHIEELKLLVSFLKNRPSGEFYGLRSEEAKNLLTSTFDIDLIINRDFENTDIGSHVQIDISVSALEENIPDVIELIMKTLFNVFVAIPGVERNIESRIKRFEEEFLNDPSWFVDVSAGKNIDDRCKMLDKVDGLSYYYFLKELLSDEGSRLEDFFRNCYAMINDIFSNDNLTIFCNSTERGLSLIKKTMEKNGINSVKEQMRSLQKKDYKYCFRACDDYSERKEWKKWKKFYNEFVLNCKVVSLECNNVYHNNGNTAIIIPSNVNYISLYGHMGDNYNYRNSNIGALWLAFDIIKQDYLREEIRVKGGAYSYDADVYTSGYVSISSFRDFHLVNTIKVFKNIGNYIRQIDISAEKLTQLKIAQLSKNTSKEDDDAWEAQEEVRCIEIKNMIPNLNQCVVEQIRDCTLEDIRNTADLIETAVTKGFICVAGSKNSILKNKELFDNIEMLMIEQQSEDEDKEDESDD